MTAPQPFDDLLNVNLPPAPPVDQPRVIVAQVTRQGVYMGDHGQDMVRALTIDPTETVADLVERALTKREGYPVRQVPDADAYLTIRLAVADRD
jgi:hypothetical protein